MASQYVSTDISRLPQDLLSMENSLHTGGTCLIQLATGFLPSNEDIDQFYTDMVSNGFHVSLPEVNVVEGVPITSFFAQKGSPLLLALIPMIPTAIIGGLVAYGIYKVNDITVSLTNLLVPTLLIIFGGVIVIGALLRKPAESLATAYIEGAGRQRLLPATAKKASGKPTRYDCKIDTWQERDRLSVVVTDKRNDKTIAEWWDDDVRQMFEDGFFKGSMGGERQLGMEKPSSVFVNSVYDYLESIGKLQKGQKFLPSVESPPDTVPEIKIPFREAPDWVRDEWNRLHPGSRPQVSVYRTEVAKISEPVFDYAVRDIVAHKGNQTLSKYVPSYESLLSSTPEQKALYFGGAVRLAPDEAIAVMDFWGDRFKNIELYVHPSAYEPAKMVAPQLTERQLEILAAFRAYTSSYRGEKFEENKVTPTEIAELQNMGLVTRGNAITTLGRNVVGSHEPFKWHFPETEPLYLPETERYDPYGFAKEVLENNAFSLGDLKLYSGKSGTNPQGVSDDVWSRAFQDLGGKFNRIGSLYLVGGTLPIPEEYLAGLFDNLSTGDIEDAANELYQNPELQEEGELPDQRRLARLHGKAQKTAYLIGWITRHPNSIVSQALVDSLERKLSARMEGENLGPQDLLPETIPAGFRIRRINIHQIKVTRTDRKGEFFIDFGYWGQLPEGPKQTGLVTESNPVALVNLLRLTFPEAELIMRRETVVIFDDDPRAAGLWEMWSNLSTGDFNPMTEPVKYVIITAQGDTKLFDHAIVPKEQVLRANEEAKKAGLRPAQYSEAPPGSSIQEFGGHWKPPEFIPCNLSLMADTEGDPLRKFCCKICKECAPAELLQEGKFPERIAWLREHYEHKHPGRWGKTQFLPQLEPGTPGYELKEKVNRLWKLACEWEHVSPDSHDIVFSKGNPYLDQYKEAAWEFLRFIHVHSKRRIMANTYLPATYREVIRDIIEKYSGYSSEDIRKRYKWYVKSAEEFFTSDNDLVRQVRFRLALYLAKKNRLPEYKELVKFGNRAYPSVMADIEAAEEQEEEDEEEEEQEQESMTVAFRPSGGRYEPQTEGIGESEYEEVEMFCQKCGKKIPSPSSFRTPESLREYMTTGKCQECQDKEKLAIRQTPGFEIIEKVKNLWNKACEFDKIPSDSKFVTFSDKNPFVKEYNEAVGQLMRFKELQSGKYQPQTIEPSKQTPNPFPDVGIYSDLIKSIGEEEKAAADYRERGGKAEAGGDMKTGDLYEHIAGEEDGHVKEFGDRAIEKVSSGGLDYLSDSPEFLAQTIENSGWKDKLAEAFTERIAFVREKRNAK